MPAGEASGIGKNYSNSDTHTRPQTKSRQTTIKHGADIAEHSPSLFISTDFVFPEHIFHVAGHFSCCTVALPVFFDDHKKWCRNRDIIGLPTKFCGTFIYFVGVVSFRNFRIHLLTVSTSPATPHRATIDRLFFSSTIKFGAAFVLQSTMKFFFFSTNKKIVIIKLPRVVPFVYSYLSVHSFISFISFDVLPNYEAKIARNKKGT